MCISYAEGFSNEKRQAIANVLRGNCVDSMKALLSAAGEHGVVIDDSLSPASDAVMSATDLTPEVAAHVKALWSSKAIRGLFQESGHNLQLPGGNSAIDYFFENASRFAKKDFMPVDDDVLRAKQKTLGVHEMTFVVDNSRFLMVDVGGQRSERRKWLPCFNDVSAVMYLTAINEYDMRMEEDEETNRLEESIKLFHKLTESPWLKDVPFIVFLNKMDLFKEKVQVKPLEEYFSDYEAFVGTLSAKEFPTPYEKGLKFMQKQFELNYKGESDMYTFATCALDNENCRKGFMAVKDSLTKNALSEF